MLAPDVVLSAAHCAGGRYSVVAGRKKLSNWWEGDKVRVDSELQHPFYNKRTTDNDFMLLFLERAINAEVDFVRITNNVVDVDEAVTIYGWGDKHASDSILDLANELQEVEVYTLSNEECDDSEGMVGGWQDSYNGQISSNMICAESEEQKDACQGDSGGPLVKVQGGTYEQVGVVSWGVGCANDAFPGVYARVSSQFNWIKKEVCTHSNYPPDYLCRNGNIDRDAPTSNPTPTLPPTRPPTKSPTRSPVNSTSRPTASTSRPTNAPTRQVSPSSPTMQPAQQAWHTLVNEDFHDGFGKYFNIVQGSRWNRARKRKSGVVQIEKKSTLASGPIDLQNGDRKIKVIFLAYLVVFEETDEFCLDSSQSGDLWIPQKCWKLGTNLNNKEWTSLDKEFSWSSSSVRLRFRCNGDHKHDDVLIDKVEVLGTH